MKTKISPMKKLLSMVVATSLVLPVVSPIKKVFASQAEHPAVASDRGYYDTLLSIDRLPVVSRIMYTGAHPDDENNYIMVYLHDKYLADTACVLSNFGEGAENGIGPEKYYDLGVLRIEELRSVRKFDRGKQMYLGMYDFGYSTSLDESVMNKETGEPGIYDPNVMVHNAARLIRKFRPDVITNAHRPVNLRDHGQHQAMGYIMPLAVDVAMDPNYIIHDENGIELAAWETKRYFATSADKDDDTSLANILLKLSERDPYVDPEYISYNNTNEGPFALKHATYAQWGAESRSNHASQKMVNGLVERGDDRAAYLYKASEGFETSESLSEDGQRSMLANIDTSISRINLSLNEADKNATQKDVDILKNKIDEVVSAFDNRDEKNKELILKQFDNVKVPFKGATDALVRLENYSNNMNDKNSVGAQDFKSYLENIRERVNTFATNLYGLTLEVTPSKINPTPGETITVTAKLLAYKSEVDKGNIEFPKESMLNDRATVLRVNPWVDISSKSNPEKINENGKISGLDVELSGYKYEYEVTISNNYKDYTGPFSAPYDESYNSNDYPYGSSKIEFNKLLWTGNEPTPQSVDLKFNAGIKTSQIDPNPITFINGNANFKVNNASYLLNCQPTMNHDILRLVPKVSVIVENESVMFRQSGKDLAGEVKVLVKNNTVSDMEDVMMTAKSSNNAIKIESQSINIKSGEEVAIVMPVFIPGNVEDAAEVVVTAKYNNEKFSEGYITIKYDHTTTTHSYRGAIQKLTVSDYKLPDDNIRIGFIATGRDDMVFDYIKGMYGSSEKAKTNLSLMEAKDYANKSGAELAKLYDTIVVGKVGFGKDNADVGLRDGMDNLISFANNGGNLVVHYQNFNVPTSGTDNTNFVWDEQYIGKMPLAPVPFSLHINGPGNVNDENSDVYIREGMENHPFFTSSNNLDLKLEGNKSTSDIWDSWIQQRCEWTAGLPTNTGQFDQIKYVEDLGYNVLFHAHDPASSEKPALIHMDMENGGHYTYSGVVWDRQLIELVTGSYKLYSNLLGLGYEAN